MRQQPQLHVGLHVRLSQRRMQGQGLNCISRIIISPEMDHDKNLHLGLRAVMDYCKDAFALLFFMLLISTSCLVLISALCCMCINMPYMKHVHLYTPTHTVTWHTVKLKAISCMHALCSPFHIIQCRKTLQTMINSYLPRALRMKERTLHCCIRCGDLIYPKWICFHWVLGIWNQVSGSSSELLLTQPWKK